MNIDKKLSHVEFLNREYSVSHLAYERENEFFQNIMEGNTNEVNRLFKPFDSTDMGRLSDDNLRNLKYHLIITIALITRSCIEGGMEMETAYNLSDIYVKSADKCCTEDEVNALHREVVKDYTQRMNMIHRGSRYPKSIIICMDYIYDNLHTKITLDSLAEASGLSPAYLSKLFHKEVGMSVSKYITQKRIEAAKNMLRYADFSCLEISNYLCFSSESHFIQVFRKYTGYTPKQYRISFFRVRTNEK